jgi:hypothetical protein
MSRKGRSTQSAVEKLVEQRRLIHDWLAKLRANVDGMPGHVIERVRNDYRTRLDGVMAELAGQRDALREALEEAQQRHEDLDELAQHKKDELSELKLRRHVGEMDDPRFKDQNSAMQAAIDQIKKDVAATIRDIERYEEILEAISAGEAPAAREDDESKRERPAREERPAAAAPAKPVDELAFLRSVTGVMKAVKPPAQTPPPPPPPPPPREPKKEPARAAEPPVTIDAEPGLFTLPGSEEMKPAAKPREQGLIVVTGNEDAASNLLPPPSPPPPPPRPGAGGAGPVAPGGVPSAAASKVDPSLVQESLKCRECGAVNRPTEWYCEKCGAELSAF